jgi:hypothetical protein
MPSVPRLYNEDTSRVSSDGSQCRQRVNQHQCSCQQSVMGRESEVDCRMSEVGIGGYQPTVLSYVVRRLYRVTTNENIIRLRDCSSDL